MVTPEWLTPADERVMCDNCDTTFTRGEAQGGGYPKIAPVHDMSDATTDKASDISFSCCEDCDPYSDAAGITRKKD